MGDKEYRSGNAHEEELDAASATQHNVDQAGNHEAASAGAAYLGGGAKVTSGTTSVTGFDDPDKQTYAHGAFMGAAGAFMKDTLWNQIFKAVWADEFDRIAKIKGIRDTMLALENNPVLAAYGECQALAAQGQKPHQADPTHGPVIPQEWDVWLDKEHPGDLSKVKIAHGSVMTTVMQSAPGQKDKVIGYGRDDVKQAKNGTEWMEIFGKSVSMFRGGAAAEGAAAAQPAGRHDAMQKALAATTADQAINVSCDFMRKENGGGLILDVKSTYSTPQEINTFIDALQAKGVNVMGVGTFRHEQLAGIEPGVRQVKFFHGVVGLGNAGHDGTLKHGDHVMFNAGSLLTKSGGWVRDVSYGIDQAAFQLLSTLVHTFGLNVGLYVQEGDVDEKAIDIIVKLVNKFPDLFKDGFAYGNLSGKAETQTEGTGMGSQSKTDALDQSGAAGRAASDGARDIKDKIVDGVQSAWDKLPW